MKTLKKISKSVVNLFTKERIIYKTIILKPYRIVGLNNRMDGFYDFTLQSLENGSVVVMKKVKERKEINEIINIEQ